MKEGLQGQGGGEDMGANFQPQPPGWAESWWSSGCVSVPVQKPPQAPQDRPFAFLPTTGRWGVLEDAVSHA